MVISYLHWEPAVCLHVAPWYILSPPAQQVSKELTDFPRKLFDDKQSSHQKVVNGLPVTADTTIHRPF